MKIIVSRLDMRRDGNGGSPHKIRMDFLDGNIEINYSRIKNVVNRTLYWIDSGICTVLNLELYW